MGKSEENKRQADVTFACVDQVKAEEEEDKQRRVNLSLVRFNS